MSSDGQLYRRMQVKVLYSFDNSPTVFLSRSKNQYPVKVAQIPIGFTSDDKEEFLTLGAFDLKDCVQQIVKSSPENFRLQTKDYAVYYKDVTEQPDEPFVANGVMSSLLTNQKQHLIPGRVCQNLSASFLFGDKANSSSLTLEVRLKLHVIDKVDDVDPPKSAESEMAKQSQPQAPIAQQMMSRRNKASNYSQSSAAMKATRTKSLPIFIHPPNQQISNIINADKLNAVPKYDSKSILERFNLAPFLLAKIIDKPARKRRRSNAPLTPSVQTPVDTAQPQRAMRTRSMVTSFQPMVSSPINEDALSEGSDDTEYNEHPRIIDEEDEEEFDVAGDGSSSPYMEQHSYKQVHSTSMDKRDTTSTSIISTSDNHFQSLPDLEDLDSKKTHTIPSTKLPDNHDLACINKNCATNDSVTWRYFETKFHPSYLNIQRAKTFDKRLYDGMFGPLCNACYLFLRNKGFMRPEAVVKKYLQQQKYKKDLKLKEDTLLSLPTMHSSSPPLSGINLAHKFATPTHAPSTINEVIRNQNGSAKATPNFISGSGMGQTPTGTDDYQDLNDFMNQLNSFGGPLTDIDIPNEIQPMRQESTPPMMATKSNTRVINLCDDEEDKENFPPSEKARLTDFEQMMIKSFSLRSSPDHNEWAQFFDDQTPKDQGETPSAANRNLSTGEDGLPPLRTFKSSPNRLVNQKATVVNMPSSPLLTHFDTEKHSLALPDECSSPSEKATRTDTTMSFVNRKSSPRSEIYADDQKV
ncbi:CIC11C00000004027 [Sungouiella intermedia]|uniref:CIC11C00000004027 n=1 Tax=Sungouiella intermedia TaxID=45354 RepID=A0A1L0BH38_9ASCO|nr:CIC11C00000004027 [[Candida] intermedia]